MSALRSERRQARPFGKAAWRQCRRGAQGDGSRRQKICALAARRTPSSAAGTRRAQADRRRGDRHADRRHRLLHCPGHERWHPAPASIIFAAAARCSTWAPITSPNLVQLLGPIASVMGAATKPRLERLITSEPLNGTMIPVEVATHVTGTLEFVSGAVIAITMSFDVPKHSHLADRNLRQPPAACWCQIPTVSAARSASPRRWRMAATNPIPTATPKANSAPSASPTWRRPSSANRPHRASGALALHVLEAMEAFSDIIGPGAPHKTRNHRRTFGHDTPDLLPAKSISKGC